LSPFPGIPDCRSVHRRQKGTATCCFSARQSISCPFSHSFVAGFIASCSDEDERHDAQTIVVRSLPSVRCCYRETMCPAFRCLPCRTTRRP
jgi:hypothetical protein